MATNGRGKPKVVVITGASAGIGRAVARVFARRGAAIALLARGQDGLEGTRQEVESLGGKALVIPVDVADAGQVETAAAQAEETLGPIDIWINNAMTSVFSPFKEMQPGEFRRVTEVTYLGYVYGTMAALKRMAPRNRGIIVQVSSALAHRSIPLQSAYCGAKHAIKGFTESINSELIHDNSRVRISMVAMPAVNTPQFDWVKSRLPNKPQPVPPIFQPEVAAEAVVWAADHAPRELLVGRSTWKAVLGEMFAPKYIDRYLADTGYSAQQTDEPEDPDRPGNLWEPVSGDHGAHGRFDHRAQEGSPVLWLMQHSKQVAVGLGALAIAGAGVALTRRLT